MEWTINRGKNMDGDPVLSIFEGLDLICSLANPQMQKSVARASLIAAAPSMLEACKVFTKEIEHLNHIARQRDVKSTETWSLMVTVADVRNLQAALSKANLL